MNQRGSIIIGIVVAIGVMLLTFSFLLPQSGMNNAIGLNYGLNSSLKVHRENLITLLSHPATRQAIINNPTNNPGLQTCKSGGACPAGPQNLVLSDLSGNTWFDSRSGSGLGMTIAGQACNTFDAVVGDSSCVYRFRVTWEADCPPIAGCPNPSGQIWVRAVLEHKSSVSQAPSVELDKYSVSAELL